MSFIENNGKQLCLVSQQTVAVGKEYMRRHCETLHTICQACGNIPPQ